MVAMVEDELKGSRPGPEFRERVMRTVSSVEVRPEKSPDHAGRVLLVDEDGRGLMIIIGKAEEAAIDRALRGEKSPRPQTHELLASILGAFGITVREARVTDLEERTFIAELVLERDGDEHVVDSRPSDAVALAMMTHARVTVADAVMEAARGPTEDGAPLNAEALWEIPLMRGAEGWNRELIHLCGLLSSLGDDSLVSLVEQVSLRTLVLALTPMHEESVAEAGVTKKMVSWLPLHKQVAGKLLPGDVGGPLESVVSRVGRERFVAASRNVRRWSAEAVGTARRAVLAVLAQVQDEQPPH
jgi:bifunctional DNase/RNase